MGHRGRLHLKRQDSEFFRGVGVREQNDGMNDLDAFVGLAESVFKLDEAAGIGRGDDARAGRAEVSELALQEPRRGLRLSEVVDARAAAAPGRLGALAQFDAGDCPQNFPWLRRDFLPVAEMAGLVIRHDFQL